MIELIRSYRQRGIFVDTNVLLLYFVGMFRRDLIGRHGRLRKFVLEDFDLLRDLLDYFQRRVTTPNVLTEVNNLSPEGYGVSYQQMFAETIELLKEEYRESYRIAKAPSFLKLGLTDTGIIDVAVGRYLVITDDFKLRQFIFDAGGDALNFDELRASNWNAAGRTRQRKR